MRNLTTDQLKSKLAVAQNNYDTAFELALANQKTKDHPKLMEKAMDIFEEIKKYNQELDRREA